MAPQGMLDEMQSMAPLRPTETSGCIFAFRGAVSVRLGLK